MSDDDATAGEDHVFRHEFSYSATEAGLAVLAALWKRLALIALILLVLAGSELSWVFGPIAAAFVVALVVLLTARRMLNVADRTIRWGLGPSGLSLAGAGSRTTIDWVRVKKVTVGRRFLEIRLRKPAPVVLMLPRRLLQPGELELIGQWASNTGVQLSGDR